MIDWVGRRMCHMSYVSHMSDVSHVLRVTCPTCHLSYVSLVLCVTYPPTLEPLDLIVNRPTQSILNIPFQVNGLHKSILLIVQYKYTKSCSEDFILKNLILRTRSCGTTIITQHSWLFHFGQAEICLFEMICSTVVQPVPWKIRLEMVIRMQNEILIRIMKLLW